MAEDDTFNDEMEIEHTNTTLDTFNNEAEEKNDNLIHDSLDDTFNDEAGAEEEHPHIN